MDETYFSEIFKRKSFHLFRNTGDETLSETDLDEIRSVFASFEPLCPEIRTAIRIVPADQPGMKRDSEYCILLYSEKKTNYLMNAGYLGEQLDLYLVRNNIASLWYGIGKADEPVWDGLDYVIMIAVRKATEESLFRKDMFKAKRKPLENIWAGDTLGIGEIARFAPSACNSQPWFVKNENGILEVQRYRKNSRISLLSPAKAAYFNRIDIGIFLCILEICMAKEHIAANRELFPDIGDETYTPVAKFVLK